MASITVRQLDESTKAQLRIRAARNGRSMEQEVREILKAATADPLIHDDEHLVDRIRRRMKAVGGIDLPELPRGKMVYRVKFDK